MNFKKLLIATLVGVSAVSCSNNEKDSKGATINVELLGEQTLAQNEYILVHEYTTKDIVDTLNATDNAHDLTTVLETNKEGVYFLSFNDKRLPQSVFFTKGERVLEEITLDKNQIRNSKVKVTTENENFKAYQRFKADIKLENDALSALGEEYKKLSDEGKMDIKEQEDLFNKKYDKAINKLTNKTWDFVFNNKNLASLFVFHSELKYDADLDKITKVLDGYSDIDKETEIYKKVDDLRTRLKTIAKGSVAPNFSSTTPDGEEIQLTDFRGKYLLVDFWASWCGPCRSSNPHLVETYKKYNSKGVEFLGVSYDYPGKREDWLKAIKDDKLTWPQVSDLNGWNTDSKELYAIYGIPYKILLDKEGKVIAGNTELNEKGLDEILNELNL